MSVYREGILSVNSKRSGTMDGRENVTIKFVRYAIKEFGLVVLDSTGYRFPLSKDVFSSFGNENEVDKYFTLLEENKSKISIENGLLVGLPDPTQARYQVY